MRISKIHLVGLAMAFTGAAADKAAADTTVSTATTTPLVTSTAGDVTVAAGGKITVAAGQAAITVDSDNDVTVGGDGLSSNNANGSRGIVLQGGFTGNIVNNGQISLLEDYTLADTDADGNLDGKFASGTDRFGILLEGGGPAFIGDITSTGGITIEGDNSAAIRLDGILGGDLTSSGAISLSGDDGAGIAIAGGVTGDVNISSTITVRGTDSIGLLVDAAIAGALNITSVMSVSGFHSTLRPSTDAGIAALDPEDLLLSGSAVDVRYSVGDGVTIRGIGVEDDLDDDGDGILEIDDDPNTTNDTDDDQTASIAVFGSAPAVHIAPDATTPTNLVLGPTASGYGFVNRGAISAAGVYDGFNATAVRIEGIGGASVSTASGFLNDGTLSAEAAEADAYALYLGDATSAPNIVNRRTIASTSFSDTNQGAFGVYLAAGANAPTFNNSGAVRVTLNGEIGTAAAITDLSNTLSSITNSGSINASIVASDDDPNDGVDPVVTGHAYAIDVSTSTINVTVNQIADTPFTDDDTIDNDVSSRSAVSMTGDIRLGAGDDSINLMKGTITGDIEFGAGADTFTIDNGATFTGMLADSGGDLTLNIIDGGVALGAGQIDITAATFGADASLGIVLSPTAGGFTEIVASGAVTFASGAVITPLIPLGLPDSGTQTFLTALGGLIGEENVIGAVADGSAPFLYNVAINVVASDPNSLEAAFVQKTPTQLGLNANQGLALNPIILGLRQNGAAAAAFSDLNTQFDFFDAYEDLMPSFASAAAELATTAIQQQQSTASNRLAAHRLGQLRNQSIWGQEIGYGLTRDPSSNEGVEYRGYGFGFAAGLDRPLDSGALLGASASFITSQAEEPGRPDGEISATFGQLNAYLGTSLGAFDLDLVAGGGVGRMRERRFVEIGASFNALSEADWWAYEGHGAAHLSAPIVMGDFTVTPRTALTYVVLHEGAYTEAGGGAGIDYDVDSAMSQRLWADAAVELSARFGRDNDPRANVIAPRLMLGYRANLIDEGAERTFRVASGGAPFTLTDTGYGSGGALAGFGFTAGNAYSSFSLGYEGEFGDELTRHSLNASIRINF